LSPPTAFIHGGRERCVGLDKNPVKKLAKEIQKARGHRIRK